MIHFYKSFRILTMRAVPAMLLFSSYVFADGDHHHAAHANHELEGEAEGRAQRLSNIFGNNNGGGGGTTVVDTGYGPPDTGYGAPSGGGSGYGAPCDSYGCGGGGGGAPVYVYQQGQGNGQGSGGGGGLGGLAALLPLGGLTPCLSRARFRSTRRLSQSLTRTEMVSS